MTTGFVEFVESMRKAGHDAAFEQWSMAFLAHAEVDELGNAVSDTVLANLRRVIRAMLTSDLVNGAASARRGNAVVKLGGLTPRRSPTSVRPRRRGGGAAAPT